MTDSEDQLRRVLDQHASEAPAVTQVAIPMGRSRSIPWGIVAPVGAAVGAAALVVAIATLSANSPPLDIAPAGTDSADVTQLTGDNLGSALGLQPIFDNGIAGCENGAEHGDHAYCLDGVTGDPLEMQILMLQIVGYPRNDTLVEYAKHLVRLDELDNATDPKELAEIQTLVERMADLKAQMTKVTD